MGWKFVFEIEVERSGNYKFARADYGIAQTPHINARCQSLCQDIIMPRDIGLTRSRFLD